MLVYLLLYASLLFFLFHFALKIKFKLINFSTYFAYNKNSKLFFTKLIKISSNNYEVVNELESYKYFTNLVYALIQAKRSYGANIDMALGEIKKAVVKDIHFEKKILSSFFGGIYQMLLISIMGLLFILMGCIQLEIPFPYKISLTVGAINLIGLIFYFILYVLVKKREFTFLDALIETCYLLRAYLRCQMPVISAISRTNLKNLKVDKKEIYLKERIDSMLQKIKTQGFLDFEEFNVQIDELWLLSEFKFETFQKYLAVIKLTIIAFFFLSSYMYIIYSFLDVINI